LWFLGTLVPVIGLVQVGAHVQADRYAYVPLVGLFLAASWSAVALARLWGRPGLAACCAVLLLAYLMVTSWTQAHYWRDSVVLWEHTLRAAGDSSIAHNNLGLA
jgi:hypothetical protein